MLGLFCCTFTEVYNKATAWLYIGKGAKFHLFFILPNHQRGTRDAVHVIFADWNKFSLLWAQVEKIGYSQRYIFSLQIPIYMFPSASLQEPHTC